MYSTYAYYCGAKKMPAGFLAISKVKDIWNETMKEIH